jgi:hypothetical protein
MVGEQYLSATTVLKTSSNMAGFKKRVQEDKSAAKSLMQQVSVKKTRTSTYKYEGTKIRNNPQPCRDVGKR